MRTRQLTAEVHDNTPVDFARLVSPRTVAEFMHDYFEKQPLYLERLDSEFYDGVLKYEHFDRFFQNTAIPAQAIRLNRRGTEIARSNWSTEVEDCRLAITPKIFEYFSQGATIIINSAHRFFCELNYFCQELERQLRLRIQPNIYITGAFEQGFRTHYDDHDVMILQIHGTKSWSVFHSPIDLPVRNQAHLAGPYELGSPLLETDLHAGDFLYVPRGFLHHAVTTDDPSVHITVGLHPPYWYEVLHELARHAQNYPDFRRAVPLASTSPEDAGLAKSQFRDKLIELVAKTDIDSLLAGLNARSDASRSPDVRGMFFDLMGLQALNTRTVLERRKGARLRVEAVGQEVRVMVYEKTLVFPLFLRGALSILEERERFSVHEITGLVNDEGRCALARQFVSAGLLEIAGSDCSRNEPAID